jgi:lipopolysaccharide export system permease protein
MLLTRYTLAFFYRFFFLSLGSFTGLYLLIEFFEKADNFARKHAVLSQYLVYFLGTIPMIVTQIIPLAVLMGVFMTIGTLSHSNELTAMRAGGMSLPRITLPLLVMGLIISLTVLAANEWLVPITTREANRVYRFDVEKEQQLTITRDKVWLKDGNALVNIRLVIPGQNLLQGISIQELYANGRPASRIDATRATYSAGTWHGENVTTTRFSATSGEVVDVVKSATAALPLTKNPKDFSAISERNDEMTISFLAYMAQRVKNEGYDPTRYRVDMHGRLATPFASLIMAILGIPFALQRGRGSSPAVGIAISIFIGISYHLFQGMMLALGYSGSIPILLAAWTPNALFGALGITLLATRR